MFQKVLSVVKNTRKVLLLFSFSTFISLNSWALWLVTNRTQTEVKSAFLSGLLLAVDGYTFTLLVSINISTTFHLKLSPSKQ